MCDIREIDPSLRSTFARIPEGVRDNLSPLEARIRLEEVTDLLAQADLADDAGKARRLRSRADRVLKAASPAGYNAALSLMEAQIRQARLDQDERRAYEIQQEMEDFRRRHPQPDPRRILAAVEVAARKLAVPPPPPNNLWSRRKNRGR